MSNYRSSRLLTAAVFLGCLLTSPSFADGTISLAWDPVDHDDLAGYRVYYDTAPDTFGDSVDVGAATQATLAGLADCTDYHVAVKAYDSSGVLSEQFSDSVVGWARPSLAAVSPDRVERNRSYQLVIDGANFQAGVGVVISDPGVTVQQVSHGGCGQIRVDVNVGATAALGSVEIQVVNPDQVFGTGAGLLAVVDDTTGPGISSVAAVDVGSTTAAIDWQTDEPADSAVFFRVSGSQLYQAAPVDPTLVTDHHVLLQGLAPDSLYEYYVQSTDVAGNATVSGAPATFATQTSPYVYIRFEADDARLTAPVEAVNGLGAFENVWIEVPAGTPVGTISDPAGSAEMEFQLPHAATWRLWLRAYGTGYESDAWFESVNGSVPRQFWTPDIGAWYWVELSSYDLGAGLHSLTLGGREGGARADRVLVTDDPSFVPTEVPGADVIPPDPVSDLVATGGDGLNQLAWTHPSAEAGSHVVIRFRTDGQAPLSPADGQLLTDTAVVPGSPGTYVHGGLINGTTYSYSVFVIDPAGNASAAETVHSTPSLDPPGDVENVIRTDTL